MNRLLKSSKFWLSVIGSVFGVVAFKLTGSTTISVMVLSAFGFGIIGTAGEDIARFIGGELPSTDDDEGGI